MKAKILPVLAMAFAFAAAGVGDCIARIVGYVADCIAGVAERAAEVAVALMVVLPPPWSAVPVTGNAPGFVVTLTLVSRPPVLSPVGQQSGCCRRRRRQATCMRGYPRGGTPVGSRNGVPISTAKARKVNGKGLAVASKF